MDTRAKPVTPSGLALIDKAHTLLRKEMTTALMGGPCAKSVTNPACGAKLSALEVVHREYDERTVDAADLCALLIIRDLAEEHSMLGLRAADWIDARAEHWANSNCFALAAQWAADAEETAVAL